MTEGGIFPAIFGTLAITVLMLVFAMPLGLTLLLNIFAIVLRYRFRRAVRKL